MMTRRRFALSVLLALALAGGRVLWLDAAFVRSPPIAEHRVFRGALHVHSDASHDAEQSVAQIAAAARAAGLDFVVLNDHGRRAGDPRREAGVLVIPQAELSVAPPAESVQSASQPEGHGPLRESGHLLAWGGDPSKPPFESGAFLAASHPDSWKNPLSDALVARTEAYELLSASSDFYAALRSSRAPWLLAYPLARPLAMAELLYRERAEGAVRYDAVVASRAAPLSTSGSSSRSFPLWCGTDDHGRAGSSARLLTYVAHLPTFLPSDDPGEDAEAIGAALRKGELYCALGLFGDASSLSVTVKSAAGVESFGAEVRLPASLSVRWLGALPPGHRISIWRDGRPYQHSDASRLDLELSEPGSYRVELSRTLPTFWFGGRQVVWIYGNPVRVLPGAA